MTHAALKDHALCPVRIATVMLPVFNMMTAAQTSSSSVQVWQTVVDAGFGEGGCNLYVIQLLLELIYAYINIYIY